MSGKILNISENGIHCVIEITEENDVNLLHFSCLPFDQSFFQDDESLKEKFNLVELQVTGENQHFHHGPKHIGTSPARRLKYASHQDYENENGRKLEVIMTDDILNLQVTSHLQFYNGISIVRSWTKVENNGEEPVGLEYVTSFALTGIAKEGEQPYNEKMEIYIPHNSWYSEAQWKKHQLEDLGLYPANSFSLRRIAYSAVGTWSSSQYLPMGYIQNNEVNAGYIWQIEHNGSWHWEISDIDSILSPRPGQLYLHLSGPTENESHWWKNLQPNEAFESVPVAIGTVDGGFDHAIGELTRYRRAIRRENIDNKNLPIIFNDYIGLMGDPTTEKLLPLIDAAHQAGSEYFTIDCGWYSDGLWWDEVGEWQPAKERFPGGLQKVINYIKEKDMIPGLWLEIEVMGIKCKKAHEVPDDWFFCRHGKRIIDHGRYQLDFRNPAVIEHANEVVDRLVHEYGVGYIKMDYNINGGIGTELDSDSFGDGLLQHNRAYLKWIDDLFERYPDLVIESCSSGGMRLDYATLQRHSIQSISDQFDYKKSAVIAAAAPTAVTPEQCAVWSYPIKDGDREATIYNMINSMLLRVHQSGHLAEADPAHFDLVQEGISYYKSIRQDIPESLPFWPLGLPSFSHDWVSLGLKNGDKSYVAVLRLDSDENDIYLELPHLKGLEIDVKVGYPSVGECSWGWHQETGVLQVMLPGPYNARMLEITVK